MTGVSAAGTHDEAASDAPPPSYERFVKDAQVQPGLFTLIRKEEHLYLQLNEAQLDKEYYEHATTANGLGGYGILSGDDFQQEARIVKFERVDPKHIAVAWPQIRFLSQPGTPLAQAVEGSTADSIEAVAPIAAEDKSGGKVVLDAAFLLGDVLDMARRISETLGDDADGPEAYHLDAPRSYFGPSKAFPKNVIIEADQTFASSKPPDALNTVTDPRAIALRVKYNFAEIRASPDYQPRYADDRVGYFVDPHIRFERDDRFENYVRYIARWNLRPADPTRPSPALKPIVYTLSNTIPLQYRATIRDAILEWNKAFERIGILDALAVQDQPSDPNFDPDDIRYNTVRWLTEANGGGFAEAQFEWDPRTGEIFRSGVLIDSDIVRFGKLAYADLVGPSAASAVDPAAPLSLRALAEPALWDPAKLDPSASAAHHRPAPFFHRDLGAQAQLLLGALALESYGETVPSDYPNAALRYVVLHEIGHDFGLLHNFIAPRAYTANQLKDEGFTARHGVSASVMAYLPLNLWPKGSPHGDYFQSTLGPYDEHAIHWGYAPVPGAKTPEQELSTLEGWAASAVFPQYAFASDEDVEWDGHAVDPRVAQWVLTNQPIDWCETQLDIDRGLIRTLDSRFPHVGMPWDEERFAFGFLVGQYARCTGLMTHFIAGEYLSRARRADRGAPATPLSPVPRELERRAYGDIDRYLFSDAAWQISPATLRRLVYSQYEETAAFSYESTPRHDISLTALVAAYQNRALAYMFSPLVLQRLDDLAIKAAPDTTMSLADLFTWSRASVYGDLANDRPIRSVLHRNLQRNYARLLERIAIAPFPGTPYDAQALAHHELLTLARDLKRNLANRTLDLQTRAHFDVLQAEIVQSLEVHRVLSL